MRSEINGVGRGEVVHLPGPPLEAEGVFVVDFHERDGGFVGVAVAGVGVHVREQVAGVVALEGDHRGAEIVHALVEVGVPFFLRARAVGIGARDVQVQVGVDAVLLQFGDEKIEPVELPGVERAAVLCEDAVGRAHHVHVVEAHAVDAKLRHARSDLRGHVLVGEIRGEAGVHAEDAQAFFSGEKMTILHAHEAVAARRLVVQPRDVCRRLARVVPRKLEGKQVRGVRGSGKDEKREEAQGVHDASVARATKKDKQAGGAFVSKRCSRRKCPRLKFDVESLTLSPAQRHFGF